ncbi:MAG: DNA-directed RNA polymerase subunit beta, partial [Pauljensenia sp.]|nr:DNA-directed RNA polymerase subunit beta [Pauljensenia sp.]
MAANSTAKQPSHRISFAKLREPLQAPNLLGLQVESFDWLLGNDAWKARVEAAQASGRNDVPDVSGLEEIFHEISPIEDVAGTMSLSFHDHRLESPKYSMEEAKAKDYTYSAPMYVTAEFMNYETGEIKSQTVFMGDFPLMTPRGTFIINGTERVVVSQLVRSPGVYFEKLSDRSTDKETFGAKVIPSRGAWLEFEIDKRDTVGVRIDRKRKQSVTHVLKAIGMTESEIRDTFAAYPVLLETLEKDTVGTQEEALLDIYRKLRPGEPANVDAAQTLLNNFYFDSRRYDLAKVGRYKINKKLAIEADPKASTLSLEDIVATVKYLLALHQGDKTFAGTRNGEPVEVRVEVDDIDNFANRRIRAVGELI